MGPQHLKVKEQDISLTKNYCITVNIKTISSVHIFIFKIQVLGSHELKESHHMTGHIHFWITPTPKIFNVCYNQLKSVNSWDTVNFRVLRPDSLNLLWRNSSFRNFAILLAESIFANISGMRFFPNIGFVKEHSK